MPNPSFDGEQDEREKRFETYLTQFRPVAPTTLQIVRRERTNRRTFALASWSVAVAVVVAALFFALHSRSERTYRPYDSGHAVTQRLDEPQPLTVGSANALLTRSPSVREALDQVALHSPSIRLEKGKRSALAVLSENKEKL